MKRTPHTPLSRRGFLIRTAGIALGLTLSKLGALAQSGAAAQPALLPLTVNFTLLPPDAGRYQRPYIAVWIEDAAGNPVRTLALWANLNGRGQRYVRELRRWYQDTQGGGGLSDTVSGPTRLPGQYSVVWDGKTDRGTPAGKGDYFVCLEYAREHGPYDLIRQPLTLGAAPFSKPLPPATEIGDVSVAYRKPA